MGAGVQQLADCQQSLVLGGLARGVRHEYRLSPIGRRSSLGLIRKCLRLINYLPYEDYDHMTRLQLHLGVSCPEGLDTTLR